MAVERSSPGTTLPMAREGRADSLSSTTKLSSGFSPVRQDREKLSEVTLETASLDRSGSSATGRVEGGKMNSCHWRASLTCR